MSARSRRNGTLVSVAHLDDALDARLGPFRHDVDDLKNDVNDLRTQVIAVLTRLEARPLRTAVRWALKEARAMHAALVGATGSAIATWLFIHFL